MNVYSDPNAIVQTFFSLKVTHVEEVMNRKLCIHFAELPDRAIPLGASEIARIFGGCNQAGQGLCMKESDCCPGLICDSRGEAWCVTP